MTNGRTKKIKAVVFDMDGVLLDVERYNETSKKVAVSSWNVVFDRLNIYHEHERLKEMFIKGIFPSYMEWTNEACRVLQRHGLTKHKFIDIINKRHLMNGAKETLKELKRRGYKTAVITGSFENLARRVGKILSLDYAIGHCKLVFDKNGNLKEWFLIPCDYEGKLMYFNKLAQRMGLNPSECAFVGDEVNDIPIFEEAGLSIAFNCNKDEVNKRANIVIGKKDLREILKFFP
ncbi:MAG: HAD family phosphatase [Candidatus Aenigmarchaeota archaeon]|nr:HAD family phosphatase [Candidatus Aenigmarchaeota archaeon]